jgi:hypothetical protein
LVKNGDRWTITQVGRRNDLIVRHTRSRLTVRLPIDYVRASTGLGYATTIHAAQGVTAETMHGLVTGRESRQQLYTMLTRGRAANHLYLQFVGDSDPHTIIQPDSVTPRTPTETPQQILARDDAPVSASTLAGRAHDPPARLFQAVQPYTDSLHAATEQLLGAQSVAELDRADQYIPRRTTDPAWGAYLAKRSQLVGDLTDQVHDHACQGDAAPAWAASGTRPSAALVGDIAVWRSQRHPSPGPAANRRRRPTPDSPRPMETAPRPAYRPLHRYVGQRKGLTHYGQHTPHLVDATTDSARTKHPTGIRTGQPHPAANPPFELLRRRLWLANPVMAQPWQTFRPYTANLAVFDQGFAALSLALRVSSLRCGPLRDRPPITPRQRVVACIHCGGVAGPLLHGFHAGAR